MDEEKKAVNTLDEAAEDDTIKIISSADEFEEEVKTMKENLNKKSKTNQKDEVLTSEAEEDGKKEESSEVKDDEKKEESSEAKKDDKKEESSEEKEDEKKKESSEEKEDEKKEESSEEKRDDKKDESSEEKKDDKKDGTNKAITQSKRLSDAKVALDEKKQDEATGTESEKSKDKKKSKKKWPIITLCVVLVLLLATYFTGFWYFSSHFYTDVAINGTDVSNMDENTAKQTLDNFYTAYVLTLHTVDDKNVVINSKDIDMNITLHEDFPRCFQEQKPYLWFVEIFNHHDFVIDADVSWNQDKLDDIYKKMDILTSEDIIDPVDAYIGSNGSEFIIIEEVPGNRLDEDIFKQKVENCLQTIQAELDLKEADCYCKPSVYSDSKDLNERLDTYSEYLGCVITIKLDDLELEPTLDLLDEVLSKEGSSYQISETKVENYVKKLANKYDTLGKTRDFTTSFGGKHINIKGANVGYQINQESTTKLLYDALMKKKASTVDVVFDKKGKTLIGDNDIGDTYIECNLTKQKVIAYKDGKKFAESDCVSGNVSHGTGTCLGLYEIQNKQSPATLRGEKVPKTKTVVKFDEEGNPYEEQETTMEYSYESHVTYWMPFNGGYGLHDADGWRSAYGGNIYFYSGSHGCINLPGKFAEKLYKNFDVGTPVLVYYEDDDPNN
ncbi:MAG: L,D-transpeptidase family protein [Lachnospiraceae bacterium]